MTNQPNQKPPPLIATLIANTQPNPSLRRLTLGASELRQLNVEHCGGHLKLLFPKDPAHDDNALRRAQADWRASCLARTYTLLGHRPEAGEIDIEIALHPGAPGPGGRWARAAAAGDRVLMTQPSGPKLTNRSAGQYLFVCDCCSLPATKAALRTLPPTAAIHALLCTDDPADADQLRASFPGLQTRHIRRDLDSPPSVMAALHIGALRSLEIDPAALECFVAGESHVVRRIKQHLQADMGVDTSDMYLSAYWKHNHDQDQHKLSKRTERDAEPPLVQVPARSSPARSSETTS